MESYSDTLFADTNIIASLNSNTVDIENKFVVLLNGYKNRSELLVHPQSYLISDCLVVYLTNGLLFEQTKFKFEPQSTSSCLMEVIEECNISESDFPTQVWHKFNTMLEGNREHEALMHLFLDLIHEVKNYPICDSFIITALELDLKSVVCVHILNAFSSIKDKLQNWESFKEYSHKKLCEEFGDEQANEILTAIA